MPLEVTTMTLMQRHFHTDDLKLHYAEGPAQGQPVVFLHGTVSRWQLWLSVLPALAEQTHVFALDARGYGTSGRSPQQWYHYLDFVHETAHFLRGAVREPAVLIGHSRAPPWRWPLPSRPQSWSKGYSFRSPP